MKSIIYFDDSTYLRSIFQIVIIGMMVSGEIIAEGDLQGGQPVFTLLDTVRENVSSVPIRLVGGKTVREGRLQVC